MQSSRQCVAGPLLCGWYLHGLLHNGNSWTNISSPSLFLHFYTTLLFKLERFILKWTVSKSSTDAQARQLSDGEIEQFAAWHVEGRNENEILMCDFGGRTRSWLMVCSCEHGRQCSNAIVFRVCGRSDPKLENGRVLTWIWSSGIIRIS